MLKRVSCCTALSVIVTPLMTEAALGISIPVGSDYPYVPDLDVNEPLCYMKTASGRILDLHKLCGHHPAITSSPDGSPESQSYRFGPSHSYAENISPPESSPESQSDSFRPSYRYRKYYNDYYNR